jgi:glycosyltransferase involved in cell wall biosynthesis
MKVAVYTIALNEAKHVNRWVDSVQNADCLVVADTGSTDGTQELLRARGVQVYDIRIKPWRFDDARNAALALVPADADMCISLDMDEFMGANWRSIMERECVPGTNRMRYNYVEQTSGQTYLVDKIHARYGFRWKRPVHETLFCTDNNQVEVIAQELIINQIQDTGKDRNSYFPLLELTCRENPNDSQPLFWYAKELFLRGAHKQAAAKLHEYLDLPSSTWPPERAEAMRFLAKLEPEHALNWLYKAQLEANYRREVWCDLAEYFYNNQDWANCFWACNNGINLGKLTGIYLDDPTSWNSKIWDVGSIACYHLGMKDVANKWIDQAISLAPHDQRLKQNKKILTGEQ